MGFLHFLWTMAVVFVFVMFLVLFVAVVVDVFRRHDISGWAKSGWLILVFVLPLIGVLIYLGVRPAEANA
jgi:hypothetical protein